MSADLAHCFVAGDQCVGDLRDMPALKRDGPREIMLVVESCSTARIAPEYGGL
jgi:hypothetical protein